MTRIKRHVYIPRHFKIPGSEYKQIPVSKIADSSTSPKKQMIYVNSDRAFHTSLRDY
jgi:hypothetical protein